METKPDGAFYYEILTPLDWFLYELATIEYDYQLNQELVKRLTFMAENLFRETLQQGKADDNTGTNI